MSDPGTTAAAPATNQRLLPRHMLAALLGLIALATGLSQLFRAELGVDIVRTAVDGIPVSVFSERGAPPAPAVVIAHGFAGSRQLMQPFALTLARNGYVAVLFDFPGHGRNPALLAGEIGDPVRAEALLRAFSRVADFARGLPAANGRIATLGHSMGGDILVRYGVTDPQVDAGILVSPYLSVDPDPAEQGNLLFVYGEYEPAVIREQGREAVAAVAGLPPAEIAADAVYGDFQRGDARELLIADGVEHIGVLYSATSLQAALDWLNRTYDRGRHDFIDARGPWLGLYYLGVLLIAWPLSRLLPRLADAPRGSGLGWKRLAPVAMLPAVLTPLLLWPMPSDFLALAIGDYIALHFALYGALTWLGLWLAGAVPTHPWRGLSPVAFAGALAAVILFQTLALTLPTDRFVASFLPTPGRLGALAVLFGAALLWFSADEWLTRGTRARGAYAATKALFLLSLMLAVALNLEELFFLVIIIPAILILFVVYGLLSRWIYGATHHPLVAAVANALAFAGAIVVSFPLVG